MFPARAAQPLDGAPAGGRRRRRRACCVPRRPPAGPSSRPSAPFALGADGSEATLSFRVVPTPAPRRRRRRRCGSALLQLVADAAAPSSRAAWSASSTRTSRSRRCARRPTSRWCRVDLATRESASATSPGRRRGAGRPAAGRLRRHAARRRGAGAPARWRRFDAIVVGVRAFNTNERLRCRARRADGVRRATAARWSCSTTPTTGWRRCRRRSGPGRSRSARTRHRRDGGGDVRRRRSTRCSPRPTRSAPKTSTAGCRSAASTSPRTGTAHYETPLAMHDPGEPPRRAACSGRATARARSSTPAWRSSGSCRPGVPGAYRLFANLLAGGRRALNADEPTNRPPARAELDDAPPFLTWRAIYLHRARRAGRRGAARRGVDRWLPR